MAILGRKLGMTRIFDKDGNNIPVTILEAGPCYVLGKKTINKNAYESILLGYMDNLKNINKPIKGFYDKLGISPKKKIKEFIGKWDYSLGDDIRVNFFKKGDLVNVRGKSKGKGFQGSIKRHGFHRGPMSHGSHYHRLSGSMGACADPSKVFKGKKLPGRMGNHYCVVQNLQVVDVKPELNIIFLRGCVPGFKHGILSIVKVFKKK